MNCLVYLPHSYTGRGPAESCVQIIRYFEASGLETTVVVAREKKRIPAQVKVLRALPVFLNLLPWRFVSYIALSKVDRVYRKALKDFKPGIAYFWPTASAELVTFAKAQGWVTVREMTNRTMASAKSTLDEAFAKAGEQKAHHISQAGVDNELEVLPLFDFVFSSNDAVDASLIKANVDSDRILKTTFGWAEERNTVGKKNARKGHEFVVGYLGMISIGKGIRDLIGAWKAWKGKGRLLLEGPLDWTMESAVKDLIAKDARVELVGYVDDIASFYESCDVLVIPTLDEGGPQVTYEIASAGVAIIATPMAKARMLEDGRNARLVPLNSPSAISDALTELAANSHLRALLGSNAKADAEQFSYKRVGGKRAKLLLDAARKCGPQAP